MWSVGAWDNIAPDSEESLFSSWSGGLAPAVAAVLYGAPFEDPKLVSPKGWSLGPWKFPMTVGQTPLHWEATPKRNP